MIPGKLNTSKYNSLNEWSVEAAVSFTPHERVSFGAALDHILKARGDSLQLLALGEALHGSDEALQFRNQLFRLLVEQHGFTAIAIESSFPRGRVVNEYVAGRGALTYDELQETGFSHGFGTQPANRELIEWMRQYNAGVASEKQISFYGFDSPSEMMYCDSPRELLRFAVDYLGGIDPAILDRFWSAMDTLLGNNAPWENPAVAMDYTQGVGLSPAAAGLRIETENLISELRIRRQELLAKSSNGTYTEALHYASLARQVLTYHAGMSGNSPDRISRLLGLRDLIMADNLMYIVQRERPNGKVFAHAHNKHLQRGVAQWQLGPTLCQWWPAGAHVAQELGSGYAVIGSAVIQSEKDGIAAAEEGTLEAALAAAPGPARLLATPIAPALNVELQVRSGSTTNPTYFPLTSQSISDFDYLLAV